jgi:tetratricopeptide (TPR) repeat protein
MKPSNLEVKAYNAFKEGQLAKSAELYLKAIALDPNKQKLFLNLGSIYYLLQEHEKAIHYLNLAIKMEPDYAEAHTFLGITLLSQGRYLQGWPEYEWRIKSNQFIDALSPFSSFYWKGQPLPGKKIIVRSEQGIGDNIQFVRFLPLVKKVTQAEVILHCGQNIKSLFSRLNGVDQIITEACNVENCGACVYMASIPGILELDLNNIPHITPYIFAKQEKAQEWKKKLSEFSSSLKVGLVYTGNKENYLNKYRSIEASLLEPLFELEKIQFFSLQIGEAKKEIEGMNIIDLSPSIEDLEDTAAIIENLNLVISVDTSVAHLAGALNKPVYLLLSKACDWRWLNEGSQTKWYPSMKLFRQKSLGDWGNVINELIECLNK